MLMLKSEKILENYVKQNQVRPANLVFDLKNIKMSAIIFEYGAQRNQLASGESIKGQEGDEWYEVNDEVI